MNVNDIRTKAKILILFANNYDMLDERGSARTGCSIRYLFWGENGEKLMEESQWDVSKPVGVQCSKASIDATLRVKIPIAPALYEGDFLLATGGDGKPVLKLQDVAYVSNIRITPKVIEGLVVPGMVGTAPISPAAAAVYDAAGDPDAAAEKPSGKGAK